MAAVMTRPMTAEEFAALPEDDGWKHELLEGELLTMPGAAPTHGDVVMNLTGPLNDYVRAQRLGKVYPEISYLLERNPDTVVIPDLSFVRRERLHELVRGNPYWPGPPDLAIEVVSPNDRPKEVAAKVAKYLTVGTAVVWVINPDTEQVVVHTLAGRTVLGVDDALDGGDVVPGFTLPVARLFQ